MSGHDAETLLTAAEVLAATREALKADKELDAEVLDVVLRHILGDEVASGADEVALKQLLLLVHRRTEPPKDSN